MNSEYPGDSPYGPPPSGQSSYSQQPPPPPLPGSSGRWGPTTMGIDPAIASGLAYLFGGHFAGILPILWLVLEKRNRYIRYNAAQALLLIAAGLVAILSATIVVIVGVLIGLNDRLLGGAVLGVGIALIAMFALTLLALEIWGIIAGFSGKFVRFPLLGKLAARLVGGAPVPLY